MTWTITSINDEMNLFSISVLISAILNDPHLRYQIPQYLDLRQQCSIMSTDLLDSDSFCKTSRNHLRLQKDHLYR